MREAARIMRPRVALSQLYYTWLYSELCKRPVLTENGIGGTGLIGAETALYGPKEKIFPDKLFAYVAQVLLVCWKHVLEEVFP